MSHDEFQVIARYFTRPTQDSDVLLGIGDDAAVVEASGPVVIATDTLVADVHFPATVGGRAVGHRVLAVNLSDLAAMGAQPRWCTLALTLPEIDEGWLENFAGGFFELADQHRVSLVGGDLTRGPLTATVQVVGTGEAGRLLTRGGAAVGDEVWVTGSLGDGAAGLALISGGLADRDAQHRALAARFLWPVPRVAAGLALRGLASAAIDVSDGLLADLGHVCDASRCGAVVDVERLPLSTELLALFPSTASQTFALSGGDDYELCFTAPPSQARALEAALAACGTPATRVGRLTVGSGVVCRRDGEPYQPDTRGYLHFEHES